MLHEEHRARASDVGDAVAIGRAAERATRDLALVLLLDDRQDRFDRKERKTEPPRQLGAGQFPREVQRLQDQLGDEIAAEAGVLEGLGRAWGVQGCRRYH